MNSQTQKSITKSLVWSGYAVFIWSIAYMLPHLYWALGGKAGEALLKPGSLYLSYFEWANGVASVFLIITGIIGLAFIYWNKGRVASSILLFIALVGCSLAASHGIYGIIYRVLQIIGVIGLESGSFDIQEDAFVVWDLVLFEPWFLIEGILFGILGWCYLKEVRSKKIWLAACIFGTILGLITGIMGVRI